MASETKQDEITDGELLNMWMKAEDHDPDTHIIDFARDVIDEARYRWMRSLRMVNPELREP